MIPLRKLFNLRGIVLSQNRISSSLLLQNQGDSYSSYRGVREWDPEFKINHEVTKDDNSWKFVERVLPNKYIPEPTNKDQYKSGWWPQRTDIGHNEPYLVRRSKNHMIPVYLKIRNRGMQRLTIIRHIKGDVWAFEKDIKKYLLEKTDKKSLGSRVDELAGKIILRGDYVHYISEWFKEKGL